MRSTTSRVVALAAAWALASLLPVVAYGATGEGVQATYDGRIIDMAESWEGATACLVWPEKLAIAECFDSEAEMNERIAELERGASGSGLTLAELVSPLAAQCASYLRLYDYTSYSGSVLYLRDRLTWLNLSNYGFDQRTSSYKIGACSATFADYANGGGSWYPTYLTEANDQSASMLPGWDNDVSSVYIS